MTDVFKAYGLLWSSIAVAVLGRVDLAAASNCQHLLGLENERIVMVCRQSSHVATLAAGGSQLHCCNVIDGDLAINTGSIHMPGKRPNRVRREKVVVHSGS
jgi:hypothetical protein